MSRQFILVPSINVAIVLTREIRILENTVCGTLDGSIIRTFRSILFSPSPNIHKPLLLLTGNIGELDTHFIQQYDNHHQDIPVLSKLINKHNNG